MKSHEERLDLLRRRALALEKRRAKSVLLTAGSLCAVLFAALMGTIAQLSGPAPGIAGSGFAGASLLTESAGGYVLTAVLAFMVGVVVTIVIRRRAERGRCEEKAPSPAPDRMENGLTEKERNDP